THAVLGVSVSDVPDSIGAEVTEGAQVQEISRGSAALDAELESGDVITKVDDNLISGTDSLIATIRTYRPGDQVTVTYERDGDEQTTTLTLDSDVEAGRS
ncbi:MAG: PDZ domain-containing protein, partial [Actinomycetota bacterium]|nr:PDZ domain-containing protein [Actinomycetota bacterium]